MSRSNLENILLYGGAFLITYYVLKSWGIIATSKSSISTTNNNSSTPSSSLLNWNPLSEHDLNNLKIQNMEVNPYSDDSFEVRIRRGKAGFGFVGNY